MKTSGIGLNLIKLHEGFKKNVYICPAGKRTIGYGHVLRVGDKTTITPQEADELLIQDVEKCEAVLNSIIFEYRQNEFDALVSLIYNIGVTAFKQSSLMKKLKRKATRQDLAVEFDRWIFIGRLVSQGLRNRRRKEKALFLAK